MKDKKEIARLEKRRDELMVSWDKLNVIYEIIEEKLNNMADELDNMSYEIKDIPKIIIGKKEEYGFYHTYDEKAKKWVTGDVIGWRELK